MTMPRAPLYDDDDMAANWQQGYDEGRQTAFLEAAELLERNEMGTAAELIERLRLGQITLDEPDVTDHRPGVRRWHRVTPAYLERIAKTYRAAFDAGDAPTLAVKDAEGCSRSTAGRYVQQARASGLLPATHKGQAKA